MFKITIIIPITDDEEYKDEAFDCIKNQTIGFDNLQIIFVNSASSTIVNNHSTKYPNVTSIELNEINPFKGKLNNIGVNHSVSNYLMFLNPSDKLMNDACESLYDEIFKSDDDIICGVNMGEINNEDDLKFDSIENTLPLIKNLNISNNLFKKSFIDNNLEFAEDISECSSAFLFNALLNTHKIKLINKKIATHFNPQKTSKEMLKGILDETFEMYYASNSKDSPHLFIDNLLFDRLDYFIKCLLKCNLTVREILGLLVYSKPLFNLLKQANTIEYDDVSPLFEYIPQEKYEDSLYLIYGNNIPKQKEIKMAAFCDSYSYNSLKYECDLIPLTIDNWLNQLENKKPNLFLLTSNYGNYDENNISKILEYCSKNNIITIFWENSAFKQASLTGPISNFDYIFTSFKGHVKFWGNGHDNVYYLMFATQPMLFNPMNGSSKVKDSVVFIGTWNKNDSEKCKLISENLNEIISKNFKLEIFDYDSVNHVTENTFPARYGHYLTINENPSIPKIYKESEMGLVINEDDNMIDSTIFELMSSNTIVCSNYADMLYEQFKNNIRYLNYNNDYSDELNLKQIKKENLHNVLKNHSYSNRFMQILDTVNLTYIPDIKRIILFYNLTSLNELEHIYNHFYSIEYPYKQMKIITTEDLLYLPDTLLKTQIPEIELSENDYFSFVDLNMNSDFVEEALLHFSYIGNDIGIKEDINKNFIFDKTNDSKNIIFNSSQFKNVISNNEAFDIYCFNNYETKVSVIISIYNDEKCLRECLDAVVNQTLKDIEIICIDNGSYDSSLDIVKEYVQNDSRIKVFSQINKGRGNAMNAGLEIANGKYIYFMDSYNIIELNGLKEMYQQAELRNLDLMKFNLMTYENSQLETNVKPEFLEPLGDIVFDYKKIGPNAYTLSPDMNSCFFKAETIKNLRFPERLKFEEGVFFIEALLNSKRVYYYDKVLANNKETEYSPLELPGRDFADIIEIRNQIIDLAKKYNHYDDCKYTIYSKKYMLIQHLFLQTFENYKKRFFEKIKEDCINKKEEYENEKIFEILDEKSIRIFNAGLNSKDCKEFETIIKNI